MDVLDRIEELTGLKEKDMNAAEKETAMNWVKMLSERQYTLDDIKSFVANMKAAVENELAVAELSKDRDKFLKARLKNCLLFEAFLEGPEKAKKALEQYLGKLKK